MMAFFLVLWIISATDKNTKTIIARYFNPVKVEEPARALKGIHGAPDLDTQRPGENSGPGNTEKSRSDPGETSGQSARGPCGGAPEILSRLASGSLNSSSSAGGRRPVNGSSSCTRFA
jgi:chemotaxis protein MotB